jgi:hypothetical protein
MLACEGPRQPLAGIVGKSSLQCANFNHAVNRNRQIIAVSTATFFQTGTKDLSKRPEKDSKKIGPTQQKSARNLFCGSKFRSADAGPSSAGHPHGSAVTLPDSSEQKGGS